MIGSKSFDRRDLLRLLGISGLAMATPWSPLKSRRARAAEPAPAETGYEGPLFVSVHASGGWDPTSFCDPKGATSDEEMNPMNYYLAEDIQEVGPFRLAPVEGVRDIFDAYSDQILVLNGVDTSTNGHSSGTRHIWSGSLTEGHPSIAALLAGAVAPNRSMSYLTNGGYDHTAGLVAPTRVGNTSQLTRLAQPNMMDVGGDAEDPANHYHQGGTWGRIRAARQARLTRQLERQHLPRAGSAMGMLYGIRDGESELARLREFLPEELDNSNNPLKRQAQLAIAAYRAGVTVSANLTMGGFDTHGNHDGNHLPRMTRLLQGTHFLMQEAERQGVGDKVVVALGSDFGRTPRYNMGDGKDHWSITSMMLMGPGIKGGRVIGSTTHGHVPIEIDAKTLKSNEAGVRITPGQIHRNLRRALGIEDTSVARAFPIDEPDLPLFE